MSKLLTIQQAAEKLGVSTKTLRRWEEAGILIPQRTVGNQRRYVQNQIADYKKTKKTRRRPATDTQTSNYQEQQNSAAHLQPEAVNTASTIPNFPMQQTNLDLPARVTYPKPMPTRADNFQDASTSFHVAQNEKEKGEKTQEQNDIQYQQLQDNSHRYTSTRNLDIYKNLDILAIFSIQKLRNSILFIGLFFLLATFLVTVSDKFYVIPTAFKSFLPDISFLSNQAKDEKRILATIQQKENRSVLGFGTENRDLFFSVNVGSIFREIATFSAGLRAPNIIYSITPGSGIAVGAGQTPTISSSDTLQLVTDRGATTTNLVTFSGGIALKSAVLNLGNLSTDPSSAVNGATYYNTSTNTFRCYKNGSWANCDTDTTSSGDITAVTVGNGLSGGASSGDAAIDLDVTTTGTSANTSANSGLETASDGLSLLRGCTNGQVLSWSSGTAVWTCTTPTVGGTMSSFTLAGTSGSSQTISDGNTLTIASGNGVTTTGGATDTVTVGLDVTVSGATATTTAASGLEIASDGLSLLRGCGNGELLKWSTGTNTWACGSDAGASGTGIATIKENDSNVVTSATTIDFLGNDFIVTNSPAGEGNISIDYTNSAITRKSVNETISGNWTFSSATPIALSNAAPAISIPNGGTLTITDGTNNLLSLADAGTSGNLSSINNVTAAGTITFSGLSTAGVVINNSSGVLSTEAQLATARGGLGASVTAAGAGELLYSNATTTYAHLAHGSASQILTSGGIGAPSWSDISSLISAGSGISTSGTTSLTIASTLGTSVTLTSEVDGVLPVANGGTNTNTIGSAGAIAYSTGSAYAFSPVGSSGQCLQSNGSSAPSWTACVGSGLTPFTTASGIIDKTTVGDRLRLMYGDASDTQLTIENTSSATIPTADAQQIDLSGGTTGIVTDGVNGLYVAAEFGNGTANTNSGIRVNIDPVNTPSGDENFYALNIDGLAAGTSAAESAINIGTNWDNYLKTTSINISGAGAVTGATGITSSGTITFSGLSSGVIINASGVLSSEAQLATARGGTNASSVGSAGSIAYSTGTAYAFSGVGTAGQALLSGNTGSPTYTTGTLTLAGNFTTSGANSLTLTTTGSTNVTLPTTGTLATLAGSETLSSKTLTAPKFADSGFIADANGNELIIFTTTSSAVNEITLANAATGNGPTITASGETNVPLTIRSKAAGALTLDSTTTGTVNLGTGNSAKTIAIGTGTAGNTINIGTDNSISDTIAIGSALDNIAITSDDWSISSAGLLTLGQSSATTGQLLFRNSSNTNTTTFQGSTSQSQATVTYTLPVDDGSSNAVLTSNGSGVLSWQTVGGLGAGGDITAVGSVTTGDAFSDSSATGQWLGLGSAAGRIAFDDQATDFVNILSANVGIGQTSPAAKLHITPTAAAALLIDQYSTSAGATGELRFMEGGASSTQYVGFKAPDSLTTNVTYTLPNHDTSAPGADMVLTWQSGNTLQWKSVAGVGAGGDITDVGSVTTGAAFNGASADDQWLGLGASAGRIEFDDQTTDEVNILAANVGIGTQTPTALLHLVQPVTTSGSPNALTIAGGAHTTLTASTEASDILLNLNRTVQFAQGALTTQRAIQVNPPTYAFATGASTLTNAVTLDIAGAPTAGTNATFTNASALRVGGATTLPTTAGLSYLGINLAAHTVTLTGSTQITSSTNAALGIGQVTFTDASSATLNNASSLYIANAPTGAGSVTLTNPYAIWVDNGNVRFDGTIQAGSGNEILTLSTGKIDADAITLTSSGTAGSTSSSSGFETVSDGLTLLKGCADGQILKWNDTGGTPANSWVCSNDAGATFAIVNIQEAGVAVGTNTDTINFDGYDFSVSTSGTTDTVVTDYTNFGSRASSGTPITLNIADALGLGVALGASQQIDIGGVDTDLTNTINIATNSTSADTLTLGNSNTSTTVGIKGVISLNASTNLATNINTGTSTGAVSIGNSSAGAVSLASGTASSFTVTSNTLTLSTATSGTLALTSAGAINETNAAASTYATIANTANSYRITDGTNPYLSLDTRTTTSGVSAFTLAAGTAPTIASGALAEYTTATFSPPTITLTGTSQVTTAMDSILFNQPTVTDASAATVDTANNLTINGAPISHSTGSVTITDAAALRINAGTSLDGGTGTVTRGYGLYVDAPSGAASNYAATFASGNVGIGDTTPAALLTVGASDVFQVNSSGAIAAAAGIISSGTIRFSALSTNGPVYTSGGNGTLNSEATLATTRGGLGADSSAAGAGELLYSSSASAYGHLASGTSSQILASGGAGAPSWSNIASLLTAGSGISISGTTTATITSTLGTSVDLTSEVTGVLPLANGGTNAALAASTGQVAYSGASALALTTGGSTGQCLTFNSGNAPTWATCVSSGLTPFTTSGGIIDKTTVGDRLRLMYGDASDTQLTIENTSSATIPTADAMQIDLSGGTTGIVTDGVNGLYVAAEFGNGTANTNSGIRVNIDPVNTPSGDETFYALNIDGLAAGTTAQETAIKVGSNWDTVLDSANLDISGAGAITGATGITMASGNFSQVGTGTFSTGTGAVSLNGDSTIAAGKNLILASGAGTFTQTYTSATNNTSAQTLSFTNSASSGTITVNGHSITPNGTSTSGTNTVNDILLNAPATPNSNTFYAINVGTGYNDILRYNGTQLINGTGIVQSAAVSGSYTGITGTGALDAGSISTNFGAINVGTDAISTTGTVTAGTLSVNSESFTDLTGDGLNISSNALIVDTTTASTTATTASNSGLETTATGIRLLGGCDATNSILKWNTSTVKWECAADAGSGSGASKWTDSGTITYLTETGDNLAVGGSTSSAPFYIDISNGGNLAITSTADTESALQVAANSLTTGNGTSISSTSTAGGASGSSYLLNLSRSGANSNTAHTAYGLSSTVTNTNGTSGTNIAAYLSASGATTANYALIAASGNVGIGDSSPAALLTVGSGDLFQVDSSGNTTLQNQADVRFGDADGSNWVAFQAPSTVSSNVTWTLPSVDASSNGDCLKSNASGVLSFATCSAGGTITAVGNITTGTAFTGSDSSSTKGNSLTFEGSTTTDDANDIIVTASNPSASRTYTLPDLGTDGTFAFLEGTQTFSGSKTFSSSIITTAATDITTGSNQDLTLAPNGTGDFVFSTDADTTATFSGSAQGTANVILTAGDLNVTNGDLNLSAGKIAATANAATGTNFTLTTGALTTGTGLGVVSTSNAYTSGSILSASLTQSAATGTSVSGNVAGVSFAPTYSTAVTTPAITGNVLNLSRAAVTNSSFASTLTVSGAVASITDNCTQTTGTCTNTANVLSLTQSYSASTGNVLGITNAGTGNAIELAGAGTRSINSTSGNLALKTTTSGDITATTAAGTGLFNVLTGNLKVGNGTPDVTQDGEDLYVEGTLEADGAARFDGVLTANTTFNANGQVNLGDGGDAIAISGTTVGLTSNGAGNDISFTSADDLIANLLDNNTDSLDIQQGTNNYININTTDTSEDISFGNATTNPTYHFLGSGVLTLAGTTVTASSLATLTTAASLALSSTTSLTLGGGSNATVTSGSNADLILTAGGTGDIAHTLDNDTQSTFNSTITSDISLNAVDINLTNSAAASTGTLNLLAVRNLNEAGSSTGTPDSLIYATTLDANETVTNGVLVDLGTSGATITNGINVTQSAGTLTNALNLSGTFTKYINATNLNVTNAGVASFGSASSSTGQLSLLNSSNAFTTTLQASTSTSASVTYTLPVADGTPSYYLQTNGSGVLSWQPAGSITGSGTANQVTYWTSSSAIAGNAAFTFDPVASAANGLAVAENSLTTGTALSLSSTSTAGGASGSSFLLDLSRSGANANTAHSAYGIRSQVTDTNATSGTNIAAYLSASGATTANYALVVPSTGGNVGIGTTTPAGRLDVTDTSNTAATLSLTNNTATTIGNGANTLGVLDLQSTSLTTGNFMNIETNGLTTGKAVNISSTGTGLTSGSLLSVNSATTGALATNGIVSLNATGAYTSTSNAGLLNLTANSTLTGTIENITGNALTTGSALFVSSTSTALAGTAVTGSGLLGNFEWNPGSSTTATGDLFRLAIGSNALVSGNIFDIVANSASLFSVNPQQFTTSLPSNFTAAGDVAIAYDLNFTNPTASFIKSAAPITIQAGETFNSSNLTLKTFNEGTTVIDSGNITGTALDLTNGILTTGTLFNITSSNSSQTSGTALNITQSGVTTGYTGNLFNITGASTTGTGNLFNISAANTTNGAALSIAANSITTGKALTITSSGTGLTTGSLLNLSSATTGAVATNGVVSLNATGAYTSTSNIGLLSVLANSTTAGTIENIQGNALTTGQALYLSSTGTGLTTGSLLYLTSATTGAVNTNGIVSLNATGAYTSTSNNGLLNVLANSTLTGTIVNVSGTGITSGTALNIVGSSSTGVTGSFTKIAADVGSAGILLDLSPDFSGSAVTGYGAKVTATDATANANTDYGRYGSLALTGNAAKIGYGNYSTVTSTSTTADTTYAGNFNTAVSGAVASGTQNTYGVYSTANSTNVAGGTVNVYGGYFKADGTVASGTINSYGVYVDNGTMNTTGTSTKYGLYVAGQSGADTNYAGFFGGDVLVGAQTDSAGAFSRVSQSTAGTVAAAGTASIDDITASAVYNGSLYIGTEETDKAEVYRYTSGTGWTVLNGTPGTFNTTTAIDEITSMAVYNGYLYIGTYESNKAEVYRYDGGTTWTLISGACGSCAAGDFAASTDNVTGATSMTVWNGSLYVGTGDGNGAAVFRYDGGTTWTNVTTGTIGTIAASGTASIAQVDSMAVYKGSLYIGTAKSNGAEVYRYDGGTTWTKVSQATAGTIAASGTANIDSVMTLAVHNGALYLGTSENGANNGQVYRFDNTQGTSGLNWALVSGNGNICGQTTDAVRRLIDYNGFLYAGTQDSAKAEVCRYDGDIAANSSTTWTLVSSAAGTVSSGSHASQDDISTMAVYNGTLYVGAGTDLSTNQNIAEVHAYTNIEGQSFALKFNGASDNANAEQNSNLNLGSIQFLGESWGSTLSDNPTSGAFLFSHSISTQGGSYDVAEDYPTRDDSLTPGDLITIDEHETGFVTKANGSYNKKLVGVYSEKPGFRLSQLDQTLNGGKAIPVALAGRVPIKVNLENGPIQKGDYLTSSSVPGVAMKATSPGQVIGKALEDFNPDDPTSQGKIVAFVNVSYADPTGILANMSIDTDGRLTTPMLSAASLPMEDIRTYLGIADTSSPSLPPPYDLSADPTYTALKGQVMNHEIELANHETKINNLEDKIASLSAALSTLSTSSTSSTSAILSPDALLGMDLDVHNATMSGTLTVLGRALLNDLTVTGEIVTGLIHIDGLGSEIHTLAGPLKLQENGLNGIELFAGTMSIAPNGDLTTEGIVTAKEVKTEKLTITQSEAVDTDGGSASGSAVLASSAGSITIPRGTTSIEVQTTALTTASLIFVTPDTPVTIGAKKKNAKTFTITLNQPAATTFKVQWWIIN